jgi:hypothetical protein
MENDEEASAPEANRAARRQRFRSEVNGFESRLSAPVAPLRLSF